MGWRRWVGLLLPFGGGLVHGAVNAGGPLIVIYAERNLAQKARFRATLSLVWIPLNVWNICWHGVHGRYSPALLRLMAAAAPLAGIGLVLGLILHGHLSESRFRRFVFVILAVLGIITLAKGIGALAGWAT